MARSGANKFQRKSTPEKGLNGKKHQSCMDTNELPCVELSTYDIKRGLKLPTRISKEVAEELGIHVGDGCLYSYVNNFGTTGFRYNISGGLHEIEYFEGYLIPLIKKVYGIDGRIRIRQDGLELEYRYKTLVTFKHLLGLPIGKKNEIKIPECVLTSPFVYDFLRGLVDTDGCLTFHKKYKKLHYYPRIDITSKSKTLIFQLNSILTKAGFTTTFVLDRKCPAGNGTICKCSRIFLNGRKNLEKWISLIGFSKPETLRRISEWKIKGYVE